MRPKEPDEINREVTALEAKAISVAQSLPDPRQLDTLCEGFDGSLSSDEYIQVYRRWHDHMGRVLQEQDECDY